MRSLGPVEGRARDVTNAPTAHADDDFVVSSQEQLDSDERGNADDRGARATVPAQSLCLQQLTGRPGRTEVVEEILGSLREVVKEMAKESWIFSNAACDPNATQRVFV